MNSALTRLEITGKVFGPAQVQLVGLEEESSEFVCRNTFDHPYPTTKIMWIPDTKGVYPDLLATSGDYLRIWRVKYVILQKSGEMFVFFNVHQLP